MKNTLPYFYNLPLALVPTTLIAALIYTQTAGVGSWSLNRTVNWGGFYRPASLEEYFLAMAILTFLPAVITAAYFLYRFVKRKDVFVPNALGILLLTALFCYALPALI